MTIRTKNTKHFTDKELIFYTNFSKNYPSIEVGICIQKHEIRQNCHIFKIKNCILMHFYFLNKPVTSLSLFKIKRFILLLWDDSVKNFYNFAIIME